MYSLFLEIDSLLCRKTDLRGLAVLTQLCAASVRTIIQRYNGKFPALDLKKGRMPFE